MSASAFLEQDGRRIEYRFVVPGPAPGRDLVMLHEGLGSVAMWKDFPERLAAATGCRTLVYSRHGYGRSSPLEAPRRTDFMHEEARRWLPALLDALGIDRPVLFGHSDGGSIALIHAALPDSRAAGVVAIAPHVRVEDVTVESIARARTAYATTGLRARLARYHDDVDSAFRGWNDVWLDPGFRDWSIEALLPSIRCPVLALQGTEDEYGTLDQVERIVRAVPAAQRCALSASGHSPHRDEPARVLAVTRDFVRRLDEPS